MAQDNDHQTGAGPGRILRRFRTMDSNPANLLRGLGLALILRLLGAGFAFVFNVMIGRLLGAEGAGLYFLALAVCTIGAVIARLGLDNALLRFVATHSAEQDWGKVKGVFRLGLMQVLAAGLALVLACWVAAPALAQHVFDKPELTGPLRWMSLAILSFALMLVIGESLKGLRRLVPAMLVSGALYPIFALALLWPLAAAMGPSGASLAYVGGTGLAAAIGFWVWQRAMQGHDAQPGFDRTMLWNSSRNLWAMALVERAVMPWLPLLLLGSLGTAAESGILGAAARFAMLVGLLLSAVNSVLAPKFAQLHVKGETAALARLVQMFTLLLTLALLPLYLGVLGFAPQIMGLFGPDFTRGGMILVILATGQMSNVVCGPVSYLLLMSGHERDLRNATLAALVAMALIAAVMMPGQPALGAAMATAVSWATRNILFVYLTHRRLGILSVAVWQPFVKR